jgi:hypothetical protein
MADRRTTPGLLDAGRRALTMGLAALLATAALTALVVVFVLVSGAAARAEEAPAPEKPAGPPVPTDPRGGEVPLPAGEGWKASLVLDNEGAGVWSVRCFPVFPEFACPELVAVDDRGRCIVLVSYSGRWTPRPTIHEGAWLGGLYCGDVDPRVPGGEIYTGGLLGNLYQVQAHAQGMLGARLIARRPGHEIHTILGGDLDPRTPGRELLLFTRPGGLYRATPDGEHGRFRTAFLEPLPGRIRDAVVLPAGEGTVPEIATVARDGKLRILRMTDDGPRWSVAYETAMGMGRLARRPAEAGSSTVLYSTLDDGRVLRHERGPQSWKTTTIYAGPQGPRGVVAGRFHADGGSESIAVYGYSGKVQLLTRGKAGWKVETIFVNAHKGHWLALAEVDGRNGTDEIVASGFGGKVILLSRPPGYALPGVATDPEPRPEDEDEPKEGPKPEEKPAPTPKPDTPKGS